MSSSGNMTATTDQYTSIGRRTMALNPDEMDLWELYYYAGLTVDPQVFRIIIDLVKLDVHPKAISDTLSSVIQKSKYYPAESAKKDNNKQESKKSKGDSINKSAPTKPSSTNTKQDNSSRNRSITSKSANSTKVESGSTKPNKKETAKQ